LKIEKERTEKDFNLDEMKRSAPTEDTLQQKHLVLCLDEIPPTFDV